jgi:hypothetical protein
MNIKPSPGVVDMDAQYNQNNWKIKMQELQKYYNEFNRLSPIMTEFERVKARELQKEQRTAYYPIITNGAINEWNAALNNLERSIQKVQTANTKEITRWDATKLNQNITLMQTRINGILAQGDNPLSGESTLSRLQAIYSEAKRSNDIHLFRAFVEAGQGINIQLLPEGEKGRIYGLLRSSNRELDELRKTPEQVQAVAEAEQSYEEANQVKKTMIEASLALGEDPNGWTQSSFATPHLRRLQTTEKGEVVILPPGDPKTGGLDLSRLQENTSES